VIFVQPGPDAEPFALAAISYCHHRGYLPAIVYGDWRAVDLMLQRHLADTVIVACSEYPHADRFLLETKRLNTVTWSEASVEALIDGDGPIPADLDPETVWAVRRLAEHLRRCCDWFDGS
jgi:hypothetical protein